MSIDIVRMMHAEITGLDARASELQNRLKRNLGDQEMVETTKTELAALRTRLEELRKREKRYAG
jgi:hypothetical protein